MSARISTLLPLALALLFIRSFAACKKKDNAKPAAATLTSGLAGTRNWHGSHYYTASGPHYPTSVYESYNYPDTAFAVTIVDDSTINFLGETFLYSSTDTTKKIYYFGAAYYYYQYGMGTGVAYYYAKDSIVYCAGDRHSTTDQWTLRNLRYTY